MMENRGLRSGQHSLRQRIRAMNLSAVAARVHAGKFSLHNCACATVVVIATRIKGYILHTVLLNNLERICAYRR